jgi:hypothetical protein
MSNTNSAGETLIVWLDSPLPSDARGRVERFKLNNRARERVRDLRAQGHEVNEDRYGDFAVTSSSNELPKE